MSVYKEELISRLTNEGLTVPEGIVDALSAVASFMAGSTKDGSGDELMEACTEAFLEGLSCIRDKGEEVAIARFMGYAVSLHEEEMDVAVFRALSRERGMHQR